MSLPGTGSVTVTPLADRHRPDWERLYAGYAEFYKVTQTPSMRATVWAWIHDPAHEVSALVAEDANGKAIGLAHWRRFARPLSATVGLYLDDLFVAPEARGAGAVDALLAALRRIAAAEGLSVVRWITADDNYRGRNAYDRVAKRSWWITYDMAP
jgi:ribosomal protein S18 acetylase RimI-like enzyme